MQENYYDLLPIEIEFNIFKYIFSLSNPSDTLSYRLVYSSANLAFREINILEFINEFLPPNKRQDSLRSKISLFFVLNHRRKVDLHSFVNLFPPLDYDYLNLQNKFFFKCRGNILNKSLDMCFNFVKSPHTEMISSVDDTLTSNTIFFNMVSLFCYRLRVEDPDLLTTEDINLITKVKKLIYEIIKEIRYYEDCFYCPGMSIAYFLRCCVITENEEILLHSWSKLVKQKEREIVDLYSLIMLEYTSIKCLSYFMDLFSTKGGEYYNTCFLRRIDQRILYEMSFLKSRSPKRKKLENLRGAYNIKRNMETERDDYLKNWFPMTESSVTLDESDFIPDSKSNLVPSTHPHFVSTNVFKDVLEDHVNYKKELKQSKDHLCSDGTPLISGPSMGILSYKKESHKTLRGMANETTRHVDIGRNTFVKRDDNLVWSTGRNYRPNSYSSKVSYTWERRGDINPTHSHIKDKEIGRYRHLRSAPQNEKSPSDSDTLSQEILDEILKINKELSRTSCEVPSMLTTLLNPPPDSLLLELMRRFPNTDLSASFDGEESGVTSHEGSIYQEHKDEELEDEDFVDQEREEESKSEDEEFFDGSF